MIIRLQNIPVGEIENIKDAYDKNQFYWIISKWNEYDVTNNRICPSCPDSVQLIKEHIKKLLSDSELVHKGQKMLDFTLTDLNKTEHRIKDLIKNKNAFCQSGQTWYFPNDLNRFNQSPSGF